MNMLAYSGPPDQARMLALARAAAANNMHIADWPYRFASWAFDQPENAALWVGDAGAAGVSARPRSRARRAGRQPVRLLRVLAGWRAWASGADGHPRGRAWPRPGTGAFAVSLVLADDRMGGWTSRTFSEFGLRLVQKDALVKRPFVTVPCWTSEVQSWSADDARRATLAQVYRVAHVMRSGRPRTLRQILAQEGEALSLAGLGTITLPNDELAYSRDVIAPHLDASDQPTVFACLFGDEAAYIAGYPQLGLPRNAALQVALVDRMNGMGGRQNEQNDQNGMDRIDGRQNEQNGQNRNGQNSQDHEDG
jgi:hypothetical protein